MLQKLKSLLIIMIGVLLIAGISAYWLGRPVGNGSHQVEFEVVRGSGMQRVTRSLAEQKLLSSELFFRIFMKSTFKDTNLKAGVYDLNDGMSLFEIGSILTSGKVQMVRVTIPEGWTNKQIGIHAASLGLCESVDEFLALTKDTELLKKYKIPGNDTEGYLYPETYYLARGVKADRLITAMLDRFFETLPQAKPPANITPEDLFKAVILASIIEREAVHRQELPKMAGVYLNRIKKGMRLEADPTVQYILGDPKKRLLFKDLEIKSPYNTYRNKGLPPGPISNPGIEALQAAFHPEEHDFLFFVLKPDQTHEFTRTYKEHLNAKKEFLDGRQ
ncbi:MAG: endolytic transglycosylase MltG [Leptonema sp. (in: Bacteria)]|nr:endolytic transglycosylase MltG [Leptonema sp. (in: bacteria)]